MSDSELRLEALKIAQLEMDRWPGMYLGQKLLDVAEKFYKWMTTIS